MRTVHEVFVDGVIDRPESDAPSKTSLNGSSFNSGIIQGRK